MFLDIALSTILPKSRLVVTGHSNGRFTAATMRRHARPLPFEAAPRREPVAHDDAATLEAMIAAARVDLAAVRGMGR